MIFGGFYVQNLPTGLNELRFLSVVRYLYYAMLTIEYEGRGNFFCDLKASSYAVCAPINQLVANGTDVSGMNTKLITGDMVLDNYDVSCGRARALVCPPLSLYALGSFVLSAAWLTHLSCCRFRRTLSSTSWRSSAFSLSFAC